MTGLAWLAATPAEAACFPCDAFPQVTWPQAEVAADGVLVLPLAAEVPPEDVLSYLTVTVRDAEGMPVDGTLTLHADFSVASWRPTVPWTPGAKYMVTTFLDREQWAIDAGLGQPSTCATAEQESEITVDTESLLPPEAPPIVVGTVHSVTPREDLEALVCCDGAYPFIDPQQPGACPPPAVDPNGICRARLARGTLEVFYSLDTSALSAAAAANVVGELKAILDAPTCIDFEVFDVAREEVFVDQRCHGEELADQLGDLELDPSAELAEACEGEPYVCEIAGAGWDSEQCVTWPDGAPVEPDPATGTGSDSATDTGSESVSETGCGCRARPDAAGGVVVLGLMLAVRRRRRGCGMLAR